MRILKLLTYLVLSSFFIVGCSEDDDISIDTILKNSTKKPLGSSAKDLLSDAKFTSLTIEIVAVQGFEPTPKAIENFRQFLQERLFKPDGIVITQRIIPSSNKAPFTTEEILDIENTTRTLFNKEDDITVYIYFANGSKEDDTAEKITLGSAYLNTSIVIYESTLRELSSFPNAPSLAIIETATLNHEFSHLLGLVDIGSPRQSDHVDPDSKGHCNVSNCLMKSSTVFGNGMIGTEKEVPKLDAQCIADLQANGGK
ncbi:hypothetical protein [Aquimarina longa]|uniref:hypothetical protein n=1 Tax=Aquimarina longa TaxID=1080221 RepID=UPI0007829CAD|nr:hypothetical protein [Aquimarina longa]